MPGELKYSWLNTEQQEWYLDLILKNRSLYNDFLTFAEKRHQGEEVRFLRTMTEIPWNGNTPLTADMQRGVFASYIRAGSFFQINIRADAVESVRQAVDSEETPDWGPIIKEARRLVRYNKLVLDFLADREKKAQAAVGAR